MTSFIVYVLCRFIVPNNRMIGRSVRNHIVYDNSELTFILEVSSQLIDSLLNN